jgi:hypothetical protein
MKRAPTLFVLLAACVLAVAFPAPSPAHLFAQSQQVDFGRDVQPIFRQYCYGCHGPTQQMNGFRLDRGADVNARSDEGRTPLFIASGLHGAAPAVRLLLDRGASMAVTAPGLFGPMTPLGEAAYSGDEAVFRLLVERGADLKAAGPLALALSLRSQCRFCADTLLKALDTNALTIAMLVASPPAGPSLATEMLLDLGADPQVTDAEGCTMLMLAAASDALPVGAVNALVTRGYMDRSYSSGQTECQYGFTLTRLTFNPLGAIASSARQRVDTGLSDPGHSRWFSAATNGNALFIGDYNGVAVGADGTTWSLWTDQRNHIASPPSPSRNRGQHAVGATPSLLPPPPPF